MWQNLDDPKDYEDATRGPSYKALPSLSSNAEIQMGGGNRMNLHSSLFLIVQRYRRSFEYRICIRT
ncbi:hypothetical protein SERLA73DRAFT_134283 [Serpula lacrymans var. lacrymans S7.3]|uniref:Uncharacterized protein n=2 Tax=Serpula lacrymans var. lacrymans TaxID=341189 RepID=F8PTT4_SERL3|nr:uncharacterized protein SERLADRAFT_385779 [Serpula lacrymans var. lacrymans S7.9]EGO01079.1 hypothetical protein SERLA73DRAFT_134283 [Serpula lacrymans var. lacrymans S7.3]EGO26737.1 hypothetical protein SERLADRAFT_385779 [Serpula lacrymans var. lacrymans S7.9]